MDAMPRANANGIELEYETFGDPGAASLLLIGGLGTQLVSWDVTFCELLAARGYRVIRFDNRDAGLSAWTNVDYTLDDMAADVAGLLDALDVRAAHVVGASMGGFIAQLVALDHRERVLSLTLMISGPNGDDQVPPTPEAQAVHGAVSADQQGDLDQVVQKVQVRSWLKPAKDHAPLPQQPRRAGLTGRQKHPHQVAAMSG